MNRRGFLGALAAIAAAPKTLLASEGSLVEQVTAMPIVEMPVITERAFSGTFANFDIGFWVRCPSEIEESYRRAQVMGRHSRRMADELALQVFRGGK